MNPAKKKKIISILSVLNKDPSRQKTMLEALSHLTPFQLLVATLLSARTKDSTVIPIVHKLFSRYPSPSDLSKAPLREIEEIIYGVGFHHTKALHLQQLSTIFIKRYGSQVPDNFADLTSLPGVGAKTANCILNYVFHQPAIAVDTHVHRISNRLGLVHTNDPVQTEQKLRSVVPRSNWSDINRLFVSHGQNICLSRKPKCGFCLIKSSCIYYKNTNKKS
jgi:endonuclease-3